MSPGPFAQRHRQKVRGMLRYCAKLLLFGIVLLAVTAGPTLLLWWNTAIPAAIGTAIFALVVFSIVMLLPLELIACVHPHFDRLIDDVPFPGFRFGRRLYRDADQLDAVAREAGLPPLSDFESHDVIDTGEPPSWHRPAAALPTVEYLLTRVEPRLRVHRDLQHVRDELRSAEQKEARFYLLVHTWADVTNAEIAARRRGEVV